MLIAINILPDFKKILLWAKNLSFYDEIFNDYCCFYFIRNLFAQVLKKMDKKHKILCLEFKLGLMQRIILLSLYC